jgi:PmbA protein
MVSSNGFEGDEEWTGLEVGGFVTLRDEGDRRADGYFFAEATHAGDLPAAGEIGRLSLERAAARLGAVQGPTRRATMVVEPMVAGSLLARLLQPANAESLSQQRSYFQGRMGELLVNERLTVTDDPLLPRGLGSRQYDSEGISARRRPIIDRGRVASLYVDTYYGRKIDMAPTTGAASNVLVQTGSRRLEDLISEVGQGILVTAWIGGNSDPTTGEFSIGLRGHLIEGGRVGAPVGEMNASGDLLALWRNLAAVGSDPWVYSRYRVPTLVFEDTQLSGA